MMLKLNQHIIDEKKNTPLTINEINKELRTEITKQSEQ